MVNWIGQTFDIPPENLRASLNIYPQQNERKIKRFWSELTGIPQNNFGKSYVKPFSKGYKKNNLYYGTVRIEIPKSANMLCQIRGWLQATCKEFDSEAEHIEKKWQALTKISRPVNL